MVNTQSTWGLHGCATNIFICGEVVGRVVADLSLVNNFRFGVLILFFVFPKAKSFGI